MDRFFDKLADILHSFLDQGAEDRSHEEKDPFMREALEELDDYLRTGKSRPWRSREPPQAAPPEDLRRDYANLEVPFGAPFEEVRRSHRRLLRKYHPDRFSRDPEKLHLATEISQKLNESYQRIRRFRGP